jgi:DNA primase
MMRETLLQQYSLEFERNLQLGGLARQYLKSRNIGDELVMEFEIGYCVTCADFANLDNRITFPIYNAYGNSVVSIGGRSLTKDQSPKYWLVPYDKRKNLYNLHRAKKRIWEHNFALVFEGFLDVIRAHQFGVQNSVATIGTAFSFYHACLLARYTDRVVFVFDGDAAGERAYEQAHDAARRANLRYYDVLLKREWGDPDDFFSAQGIGPFVQLVKESLGGKSTVLGKLRERSQNLLSFGI